jgi:hypothetical protein
MSNQTNDLAKYISNLNSASTTMIYYFMVITTPIGLLGNVLCIVIYSRPSLNKKTNIGFLYVCLCCTNLLMIFYYLFITRATVVFKYIVSLPCGLSSYLVRIFLMLDCWVEVIISFDRFVAVMFPSKARFLKKKVFFWLLLTGLNLKIVRIKK